MYFFKNTAGNWVLGSETTSFTSKAPCTLRRDTPTVVTVRTIEKRVLLIDKTEVTAIKKNAEGDFYANYAEFVAAVSDFFDNAPITADEVDAKIGAEVDILSDRIDTVENIANAASSGFLGSIKPTDAAPTPDKNGYYEFNADGSFPAWLTPTDPVTATVHTGDRVYVKYTAPSTYSYTWGEVNKEGMMASKAELNSKVYSEVISVNATYQSSKLKNVKLIVTPEYEGCTFYIIQLGWLDSLKLFLFDVVIKNIEGTFVRLNANGKSPVKYNSIPLINKSYSILFGDIANNNAIGSISFEYDWEAIAGDISDNIINSSEANYEHQHIEVIPFFDYVDNKIYSRVIPSDFPGSYYQADKLKNLKISLSPKYKGYKAYIIQCGWLDSLREFFFQMVLKKPEGGYVNYIIQNYLDPGLDSIPLINKMYSCKLIDIDESLVIGSISFEYDWETIAGDISNHLLNTVVVYYETQHVEVIPFFDYIELSDLSSVLSVKSKKKYGIESTTLHGLFPTDTTYIIGVKDEKVINSGWLQSITLTVATAGNFKIGIGHLDQRNWYIENQQFSVSTNNTGLQTFDVSNKNIVIPEGDQLFIFVGFNGSESIHFDSYGSTAEKQFIFGTQGTAIVPLDTTYGGECCISWDVKEISTILAFKGDVDAVTKYVDNVSAIANNAINNSFKIKDRQGNYYKMVYLDGAISLIPFQFESAMVIGNSITVHPQTEIGGGWYASGRGMASTVPSNDFCAFLETGLKSINPSATVTRKSAADLITGISWEQTLQSDTTYFDFMFSDVASSVFDLIVFRLSENMFDLSPSNMTKFIASTKAIINYLWTKWPNAEVIITSDTMDNEPTKNAALITAASSLGVTYVDAGLNAPIYKNKFSDWNSSYAPYFYEGDDNVLRPIQDMFSTHPNDFGMLRIANAILGGINYNQLNIAHSINVNYSGVYKTQDKWVKDGIATVFITGTLPTLVSVKDRLGADISFNLFDMSTFTLLSQPVYSLTYAITFVMPDSDVNMIIS